MAASPIDKSVSNKGSYNIVSAWITWNSAKSFRTTWFRPQTISATQTCKIQRVFTDMVRAIYPEDGKMGIFGMQRYHAGLSNKMNVTTARACANGDLIINDTAFKKSAWVAHGFVMTPYSDDGNTGTEINFVSETQEGLFSRLRKVLVQCGRSCPTPPHVPEITPSNFRDVLRELFSAFRRGLLEDVFSIPETSTYSAISILRVSASEGVRCIFEHEESLGRNFHSIAEQFVRNMTTFMTSSIPGRHV